MNPDGSVAKEGCPSYIIDEAINSSRQVARIIWDEPDTPVHCRGYIQWSVRPYWVTDRCDGTRDSNAMLTCQEFCNKTGLDLVKIYATSYPDENNIFLDEDYAAYLEEQRQMTVIPEVNQSAIIHLLNSLYSMNWRSLTDILANEWNNKGFNTDNYWDSE
jgi:hypothetical protein